MKNIFILFLIILVYGCGNTSNISEDAQTISVTDFSEHLLNMSEFVDSIQYIPLETTSDNLIGEASQLVPLKDRLMIVDKTFTHSIFFFTNEGQFLSKIARQGIAPEEYIKISSVALDLLNKRIFIFDNKQKKILLYTMEGQFIDSFQPDFYFTDIAYVGDQKLVCYCDYGSNVGNLKIKDQVPMLILYDLASKKRKTFCYEDVSIEMQEITDSHLLSSNNTTMTASCSYPLSDYVYKATSKGVFKEYFLDFGANELAHKDVYMLRLKTENITPEQLLDGGKSQPDFMTLTGCMESEKLAFFGYKNDMKKIMGVTLLDKESKKQMNALTAKGWPLKNDIDGGYPILPCAINGRQIYTIVPPMFFEDKNISDPKLIDLMSNISSEDNPIIMISTVKMK